MPQRTVYLVTAAIVAAMVGGYALAATSTTTLTNPQGSSQGTTTPGALIAGYSWTNSELVVILAGADATLGTSNGAGNALGGTQLALTGCAIATCSQNNQPALGPSEVVGDYAEEIIVTVAQGVAAPAHGVEAQFVVTCTACSTPTLVANAFTNAGVSTNGGGSIITVNFLIDTGISASSTTTPVVTEVSIVMDNCVGLTTCP
ncbi:MAG: hypothetical protein WB786_01345 [Thermoplasmata archaeon]